MSKRSPFADRFDRQRVLKSVGFSLTINALCPFALYRVLQSHFPPYSVIALLYATIFPIIGVIRSLVRERTLDVIAIIAMAALVIHTVVTLLARNIAIALVVRSLDGAVIGFVFVISALIRRPILLFLAKQIAATSHSERARTLDRLVENDSARTFFRLTLVWGICLITMSGLHVVLALELPPSEFLLVSPVVGIVTILALFGWTGRYLVERIRILSARNR